MQLEKERLVKAWLLYQDGESERAMEIVKDVLRNNPRSAEAWFVLAKVVEDRDKAIYSLRRVLSIDPQHLEAQQELQHLLAPQESHLSHKVSHTEAKPIRSSIREAIPHQPRNKSYYPDNHSFQSKKPLKFSDRLVIALVILIASCFLMGIVGAITNHSTSEVPTANPQESAAIDSVQNYSTDLGTIIQGIGLTFALLEESGHTYRPSGWYVREEPGHYVVTFYFYLDGKKDKAVWWFVPNSQLVFPKNEWARTFMGE